MLANFLAISGAGAGFDSGGRLAVSAVLCRAERGGAVGGDSGAANRLLAHGSRARRSCWRCGVEREKRLASITLAATASLYTAANGFVIPGAVGFNPAAGFGFACFRVFAVVKRITLARIRAETRLAPGARFAIGERVEFRQRLCLTAQAAKFGVAHFEIVFRCVYFPKFTSCARGRMFKDLAIAGELKDSFEISWRKPFPSIFSEGGGRGFDVALLRGALDFGDHALAFARLVFDSANPLASVIHPLHAKRGFGSVG